jgi:hypothetical protein
MKQAQTNLRFGGWLLLIPMLTGASISYADPAMDSCRRGRESIAQRAHSQQKISIVKSDRAATDDAGTLQETIELRWTAFSEEFVVNLKKNSPKPEQENSADANPLTRELFAGQWQDHKAELVLFWRWPSGAWEGDLKQGDKLYMIRVPCEQRPAGSSEFTPLIYFIKYPEEPEA